MPINVTIGPDTSDTSDSGTNYTGGDGLGGHAGQHSKEQTHARGAYAFVEDADGATLLKRSGSAHSADDSSKPSAKKVAQRGHANSVSATPEASKMARYNLSLENRSAGSRNRVQAKTKALQSTLGIGESNQEHSGRLYTDKDDALYAVDFSEKYSSDSKPEYLKSVRTLTHELLKKDDAEEIMHLLVELACFTYRIERDSMAQAIEQADSDMKGMKLEPSERLTKRDAYEETSQAEQPENQLYDDNSGLPSYAVNTIIEALNYEISETKATDVVKRLQHIKKSIPDAIVDELNYIAYNYFIIFEPTYDGAEHMKREMSEMMPLRHKGVYSHTAMLLQLFTKGINSRINTQGVSTGRQGATKGDTTTLLQSTLGKGYAIEQAMSSLMRSWGDGSKSSLKNG